jgi:hypothetical protein
VLDAAGVPVLAVVLPPRRRTALREDAPEAGQPPVPGTGQQDGALTPAPRNAVPAAPR